jgi:branched-chain amino acid transport system permease protein
VVERFAGLPGRRRRLLQIVLSGLAIGAIYGLMGMALSISFYVTRVINFAQGQVMMVAIMTVAALTAAGYSLYLAIAAGLLVSCAIGVLSYLIAVRPILRYNRFSFGWLVSTLGFALVVENATAYLLGPHSQAFPALLNNMVIHIGGGVLTGQQAAAILIAILFTAGFELLRRKTFFGKLGMATALDPEMASAIGINTMMVAVATFAISAIFAAVAGILIAPRTFANPYLGDTYGTYGFVAMMIGGTEKPSGAMWGGFLLGLLSEGANALINSQASDWFPFVVLVATLIVSPQGLFSSGNIFARMRPFARVKI